MSEDFSPERIKEILRDSVPTLDPSPHVFFEFSSENGSINPMRQLEAVAGTEFREGYIKMPNGQICDWTLWMPRKAELEPPMVTPGTKKKLSYPISRWTLEHFKKQKDIMFLAFLFCLQTVNFYLMLQSDDEFSWAFWDDSFVMLFLGIGITALYSTIKLTEGDLSGRAVPLTRWCVPKGRDDDWSGLYVSSGWTFDDWQKYFGIETEAEYKKSYDHWLKKIYAQLDVYHQALKEDARDSKSKAHYALMKRGDGSYGYKDRKTIALEREQIQSQHETRMALIGFAVFLTGCLTYLIKIGVINV